MVAAVFLWHFLLEPVLLYLLVRLAVVMLLKSMLPCLQAGMSIEVHATSAVVHQTLNNKDADDKHAVMFE